MVRLGMAEDVEDGIVGVEAFEVVTKVGTEKIIRSKHQHLILNKNK